MPSSLDRGRAAAAGQGRGGLHAVHEEEEVEEPNASTPLNPTDAGGLRLVSPRLSDAEEEENEDGKRFSPPRSSSSSCSSSHRRRRGRSLRCGGGGPCLSSCRGGGGGGMCGKRSCSCKGGPWRWVRRQLRGVGRVSGRKHVASRCDTCWRPTAGSVLGWLDDDESLTPNATYKTYIGDSSSTTSAVSSWACRRPRRWTSRTTQTMSWTTRRTAVATTRLGRAPRTRRCVNPWFGFGP